MYRTALVPLLVRLASAAISLGTFQEIDCGGNLDVNVHSNPANAAESSDCVATNQFNAVQVISADQGFQCNIYSDRACQSFLDTFQTVGECGSVIGSGVICFSQADFDDPLAGATAALTVGTKLLTVTTSGSELIANGSQTSCSSTGCDPSNPFTLKQEVNCKDGTFTVKMEGNYDNTDQRDYMVSALAKALDLGTQNKRDDPCGFTGGLDIPGQNPQMFDIPTFVQVVINDAKGNNVASISATIAFTADPGTDGSCDNILGLVTESALSALPAVGEIAGLAFKIACL